MLAQDEGDVCSANAEQAQVALPVQSVDSKLRSVCLGLQSKHHIHLSLVELGLLFAPRLLLIKERKPEIRDGFMGQTYCKVYYEQSYQCKYTTE